MKNQYTFEDLVAITRRVIQAFDDAEQRPWTIEASMIEMMKQTGDLARHVMMAERYYLPERPQAPGYATSTEDIGDELADILYCVIRVAEHYHIDLERAHLEARRKELRSLGQEPDF
ncbi:MAG TPA: hypothetical protein VGN32_17565 [Ktedonobacterales bacterium]|nr:hypothetical protein [Ktedonobacterales bacterium]